MSLAPLWPLDWIGSTNTDDASLGITVVTKVSWYKVVNHVDLFPESAKIKSALIELICNPQKFSPAKFNRLQYIKYNE